MRPSENLVRNCWGPPAVAVDVVLVWRLDRWGRSVTDLLATLQELEHLGVGFVSLTEALDLMYFVADSGTGFHGTDSDESIAGRLIGDSGEYDLWLHRTRDAKWKASVIKWADQISADRHVDQIPQFNEIP